MAEYTTGVQGGSNLDPSTSTSADSALNTSNLTTGEAIAASPTTAERLAGITPPTLTATMETIARTPVLDPSLLPHDRGLALERTGLVNRMEQLEGARQDLIDAYNAGEFVSTQHSDHTLAGLDDYIADYNALASAVNTYNGLVNVGNTQTLMQALPFQVAGSAILGLSAAQTAQSAYTYALSNPVGVTSFADDFLNTLLVPGSPSPSMVGYGTGIGASIGETVGNLINQE